MVRARPKGKGRPVLEHVGFFETVVTACPNSAGHSPLLEDLLHVRPPGAHHVRRLFLLSASGQQRPMKRSAERVDLGRPR